MAGGMSPIQAQNECFSRSNVRSWLNLERYEQHLRAVVGQSDSEGCLFVANLKPATHPCRSFRQPLLPESRTPGPTSQDLGVDLSLLTLQQDVKPALTPRQSSEALHLHGQPEVVVMAILSKMPNLFIPRNGPEGTDDQPSSAARRPWRSLRFTIPALTNLSSSKLRRNINHNWTLAQTLTSRVKALQRMHRGASSP